MLAVPDSLLSEDALSGSMAGEDEEGVVSDPGTEILTESDEIIKVSSSTDFNLHMYTAD